MINKFLDFKHHIHCIGSPCTRGESFAEIFKKNTEEKKK